MGGLLGKNKKRVTSRDTIDRLHHEKDRLSTYCQFTERQMECSRDLAKQKLREGNPEDAKTFVKKKIYYERELQRSTAQLDKIDQVANDLALADLALENVEMGGLFGKHKKPVSRITEQDKAVLQLKQQRDKLKQYQKKIEINLERDRQFAKQLEREGKREKVKSLLKKKRYQEQLLKNTDAQLERLEQLTHDLEFAQIEIKLNNMGERKVKRGRWKSIVKRKHKRQPKRDSQKQFGNSVDEDIEIQVIGAFNQKERDKRNKILKESKKGVAKQKAIGELLSGQLSKGEETAVEKELEEIMNGGYQLPDMEQEKYACNKGLKKTHEAEDVTAISA